MGREDPLEKKWQPTPVFLPGKLCGQWSLGTTVYGVAKKSDMTEQLNNNKSQGKPAAKSLQLCPTLCNPIDGSPPGSSVPGSPGKSTGVGCHFLLQCMNVKTESEVTKSCLTLSDPMDCSPSGSSVHGIFQARMQHLAFADHVELDPVLLISMGVKSAWRTQNFLKATGDILTWVCEKLSGGGRGSQR